MRLKDRETERYWILIPFTDLFLGKRSIIGTKKSKLKKKSSPQGYEKQRLQGDIDRKGEKWTFQ